MFGARTFGILATAGMLLAVGSRTPLAAQQSPLPEVVHAWVPLYPFVDPVPGVVTLHVSTNGNRVLTIDTESDPGGLARAATDNVRTWQFEPHPPTSFDVTFNYSLLPSACKCKTCGTARTESVILHLPTAVAVQGVHICDAAVERGWSERPRLGIFDLPSAIFRGSVKLLSKLA